MNKVQPTAVNPVTRIPTAAETDAENETFLNGYRAGMRDYPTLAAAVHRRVGVDNVDMAELAHGHLLLQRLTESDRAAVTAYVSTLGLLSERQRQELASFILDEQESRPARSRLQLVSGGVA